MLTHPRKNANRKQFYRFKATVTDNDKRTGAPVAVAGVPAEIPAAYEPAGSGQPDLMEALADAPGRILLQGYFPAILAKMDVALDMGSKTLSFIVDDVSHDGDQTKTLLIVSPS
ncbi:MAG TPA: hypothetical protein VF719_12295 [Abditibacteriaceae bacterium]|jgi:hypothetical protein